MAFSQAPRATAGLIGITELSRKGVTGTANVGSAALTENLSLATEGVTFEVIVDGSNTVEVDLDDFAISFTGAGVSQVETQTIVGTITLTGFIDVIVTSNDLAGSPITIPVAVTNGDSASTVGGLVRAALNLNATIIEKFNVGGSTTAFSLTASSYRRNDPNLNLAYTNGTAAGLTPDPSSVDTTAGVVEPTVQSLPGVSWASDNFQGGQIPTPVTFYGFEITVDSDSSEGMQVESGTFYSDYVQIGETAHKHSAATGGIGLLPADTLLFAGQGAYSKALVTLMFSTA